MTHGTKIFQFAAENCFLLFDGMNQTYSARPGPDRVARIFSSLPCFHYLPILSPPPPEPPPAGPTPEAGPLTTAEGSKQTAVG